MRFSGGGRVTNVGFGTIGLVVGFVLAAFFLVPRPMVKMNWRR
jgi:hypothetical protein